ncbi:MAG TPA: MaoC family dehydratase [Burkholderiaceae bacterium]|nr:MaoC family dehydratase [Burkholderiaceae bacterium]
MDEPNLTAARHRLHWEDFPVGSVREVDGPVVARGEIIEFATRFDPQPFHLDEAAARQTHFGGLVASGWHTAALAMRMICDAYLHDCDSRGSPGIDKLRWTAPVRPGDRLRMRMTVLSARPMQSRPGVGLVESRWQVFNQHDELVLEMSGWGMFGRRPAGAGGPADTAA